MKHEDKKGLLTKTSNFLVIDVSHTLILPYAEGIKCIASMENAERYVSKNSYRTSETGISPMEDDNFRVEAVSEEQYLELKMIYLMRDTTNNG